MSKRVIWALAVYVNFFILLLWSNIARPDEKNCEEYLRVALSSYEESKKAGTVGRASHAALGALAVSLYNVCKND